MQDTMIHAGITGPRTGATHAALLAVAQTLCAYNVKVLHDGDAVGVDESVYHLARALDIHVILHPPQNPMWRALCGDSKDTLRPEKGYYNRNMDIVDESDFLISVPAKVGLITGGTGHATDYARETDKPLIIIWPDGKATYERWDMPNV